MTPSHSDRDLWGEALHLIPGGTHTISKRVTTFLDADHFPPYVIRGKGAWLYDREGRRYLDYIAALGAVLLGYAVDRIDDRVARQLRDGFLFSLPHPCEVELARVLTKLVPSAEQVRLFKTGAEATSAAIRVARLATGRERVLCCGYHGWHDWWAVVRSPAGIPVAQRGLITEFPFNDLEAFRVALDSQPGGWAAVILTPAAYGTEPAPGFLPGIRDETTRRGIPLIFDEVITGFRWALGGAQARFGVTPDLTCIGKAMANGMPLSALVGCARLMEPMKDNWISSTYASDALAIVAALETLEILCEQPILEELQSKASLLQQGIVNLSVDTGADLWVGAQAPAIRFGFNGPADDQARRVRQFVAGCVRRGVLVRRDGSGISLCLMAAVTPADIESTLSLFRSVLHEIH
ncbi:MAG: aminotransferase class III-fold pyridoxal phosphate-dependent enzyme [Opitutaceae bacterium]